MSDSIVVVATEVEYETSTASTSLRWSNEGRLQQLWTVQAYRGNRLMDGRVEWRDVPIEPPSCRPEDR